MSWIQLKLHGKKLLKMKIKSSQLLPNELVDFWPEVLEDIEIKAIPLKYVDSFHVFFMDGRIWEIDLTNEYDNFDHDEIEKTIDDFFLTYNDSIVNIEFCLNIEKVIADVKSKTAKFLKKHK